jgi:hypothetical protein
MSLIDNKGRLFGIINIIDLAVLLAVVLLAGGVVYKFLLKPGDTGGKGNTKTYTVTVKCPMVPESAATRLSKGDRIFYSDTYVNGEVESVRYEDAKEAVLTADGQYVTATHPYLKDVYVTLKVFDDPSSDAIMLGKYQVNLGKDFTMKTTRVEIMGVVIDISE